MPRGPAAAVCVLSNAPMQNRRAPRVNAAVLRSVTGCISDEFQPLQQSQDDTSSFPSLQPPRHGGSAGFASARSLAGCGEVVTIGDQPGRDHWVSRRMLGLPRESVSGRQDRDAAGLISDRDPTRSSRCKARGCYCESSLATSTARSNSARAVSLIGRAVGSAPFAAPAREESARSGLGSASGQRKLAAVCRVPPAGTCFLPKMAQRRKWASLDAPQQGRGKSRHGGGFGASGSTRRAVGLEAESRGPIATPTVALGGPRTTLSNSRALWLTGGLSLTAGLLSGGQCSMS